MLIGVDEVGRGCWAGPLVAGAVALQEPIVGLRDSKKLSKIQRGKLALTIQNQALAWGLGWVTPSEIDKIGLTAAVRLAMERALEQITIDYDELIIDGSYNFFTANPKAHAIIKADDSVPAVSAASIIAKVARDAYMARVGKGYPSYGFEKHVGYGTAYHLQQLRLLGVSPLHRKSYKPIQNIIAGSYLARSALLQ